MRKYDLTGHKILKYQWEFISKSKQFVVHLVLKVICICRHVLFFKCVTCNPMWKKSTSKNLSFSLNRKNSRCLATILWLWDGSSDTDPVQTLACDTTEASDSYFSRSTANLCSSAARMWGVLEGHHLSFWACQLFLEGSYNLMLRHEELNFSLTLYLIVFFVCQLSDHFQIHELYRKLTNESFEEFKFFISEMDTGRKLAPLTSDGTKCPLCPKVWTI